MVSLLYHSVDLSWKKAIQKAGCVFAYFVTNTLEIEFKLIGSHQSTLQ